MAGTSCPGAKLRVQVVRIPKFISALCALAETYITWPSAKDRTRLSRAVRRRTGFPGVVGSVHGTHVNVEAPRENLHVTGTGSSRTLLFCKLWLTKRCCLETFMLRNQVLLTTLEYLGEAHCLQKYWTIQTSILMMISIYRVVGKSCLLYTSPSPRD